MAAFARAFFEATYALRAGGYVEQRVHETGLSDDDLAALLEDDNIVGDCAAPCPPPAAASGLHLYNLEQCEGRNFDMCRDSCDPPKLQELVAIINASSHPCRELALCAELHGGLGEVQTEVHGIDSHRPLCQI